MNSKRGQVTIFILLGLVILIILGFVFYSSTQRAKRDTTPTNVNDLFESIDTYISACNEEAAARAGIFLGNHGGDDYIPTDPLHFTHDNGHGNNIITVAVDHGNRLFPTLDEQELNYANKVVEYLLECVDDFRIYKDNNIDVEYEDPIADVEIFDDYVLVKITFEVNAKLSNAVKNFNEYPAIHVPLRFGTFWTAVDRVVSFNQNYPGYVSGPLLDDIKASNDIGIEAHMPVHHLVFYFWDMSPPDENYLLLYNNGEPFRYNFGELHSTP